MDISKIITDSIDKSIEEVAKGTYKNARNIEDEAIAKLATQDKMLMNYTNILLATYHEELKKELSKHGIEL